MRSFATALLVAGALVSQTAATIYVTAPVATTTCNAGVACNVQWNDDGNAPPLSSIGPCSIDLCTGGQQQQTCLQNIQTMDVSTNAVANWLPNASVGPNGAFYFIKFTSVSFKDPSNPAVPYTAYSAKFTLNGMTGTFNSTVQAQISGVAASPAAATTPAATTPAAAATTPASSVAAASANGSKTTAAASASKASASSASATHSNGAVSVTAPGVVSSTIGLGMVMSFASFFLGALAFGL